MPRRHEPSQGERVASHVASEISPGRYERISGKQLALSDATLAFGKPRNAPGCAVTFHAFPIGGRARFHVMLRMVFQQLRIYFAVRGCVLEGVRALRGYPSASSWSTYHLISAWTYGRVEISSPAPNRTRGRLCKRSAYFADSDGDPQRPDSLAERSNFELAVPFL